MIPEALDYPASDGETDMTIDRQSMDVDIACVGFGPATGGFLTTLSQAMTAETAAAARKPGHARHAAAGDLLRARRRHRLRRLRSGHPRARHSAKAFPISTRRRSPWRIRSPRSRCSTCSIPLGASRRAGRCACSTACSSLLGCRDHAVELPYIPRFLRKEGGLVLSIGQFNQWVGSQLIGCGLVQVWPGSRWPSP